MNRFMIAYDIGGTKIKAGLIASSGEILDLSMASSRASEGPDGIMFAAQNLTDELLARNELVGIAGGGISTGGVVYKEQGQIGEAADFMPGWKGFEIRKSFEAMLERAVVVDNDGNCALFAEVHKQSLNQDDAILLALGTGLGGAIYANGCVRGGASSLAGHFGQTLVGGLSSVDEWEQLETVLSGSGLAYIARRIMKERDLTEDSLELFPNGYSVIEALASSEVAQSALTRWVRLLARTCHNLQWNYDPNTIIIGGGMVEAKDTWWPQFSECLTNVNQRFHLPREMDVRPAVSGNNAAMVGAGLMAWQEFAAGGASIAS